MMSKIEEESFGIYIHIPFCKSKCAYCSFVSDACLSDCKDYVDALIREIRDVGGGRHADTVYIGGGTPSVLKRGELKRIMSAVRENFSLFDNAEISSECNPDSATREFFDECVSSGVNRVSMGLQSANDALLKKIGRIHTFGQFTDSVEAARAAGLENIGADLMLGLPSQTEKDVTDALRAVIERGLKHVSVYGLSVEEGTPLYKSGYEPDEDMCADFYDLCYETLKSAGYHRYEVSNFAIAGKECRHNIKYWTSKPYLGFGVAAHSFYGNTRRENTADRKRYMTGERVEKITELTKADRIEETIMLSLRTDRGLDLTEFENKSGCDLLKSKRSEIDRLKKLGLINIDGKRLRLTEQAYYKMNYVILALL